MESPSISDSQSKKGKSKKNSNDSYTDSLSDSQEEKGKKSEANVGMSKVEESMKNEMAK